MDSQQPPPDGGPTVIGIGASAGGLAALKEFLNRVPVDSGLAFVIVVHLAPDHESHLAELLQPHAAFPVEQVTDTVLLESNHAYVIPPNANLNSIDTHLRLSKLEKRRTGRAPIDHFFRTMADTHDGHSVAVILTGTGSDGTLGVRDIKAHGGLIVVQDPHEAEYDGMPQSAIATGLVDLILPVAEIPEAILRFNRIRPRVPLPKDGEQIPQDEGALLQKIFAQLRARADRDFSNYKRSTILRRIARRMQLNYTEDLSSYLERLREKPEEVGALADDLLIMVTRFFRDPEVFGKLKHEELPHLFAKKRAEDTLRVWSVGCATGEEAYSIAILLLEELAGREDPPRVQIFASDLHTRSLAKAREGFYPGDIAADVSPERLKRFFREENGGYRITKEIRDLVVFAPHNLMADPPFSRLDIISCRNLLIYLEREVQRDVIELFHYALNPEGLLVLGSAETVESPDLFRVENKKLCFFRKRNVLAREPVLPVFPLVHARAPREIGPRREGTTEPVAYGHLHQQMVELYAPPSVLVSPDNKIVHFSEQAGRYLVHPGGEPTMSVFRLVREELRIELQASLQSARARKAPFDSKPVPVHFEGQGRPVVIHVRPALETDREGFALIIFEEREPKAEQEDVPSNDAGATRILELEDELNTARQRLQTVVEEHETSQEEMKASSEEMQSTNEELRSTLEELETSKEELQSINEELQTVNQQNRHKVEELAQLTGDLQNLLAATDIATLFLDRELRILRFTPKLGDLFNVRVPDRGRPIFDLTNRIGYHDLRRDAESVLSNLVPVEREVQDDKGRWYLTRVLPYRSTEDRIGGIVITFIDIDNRKRMEDALRRSEERLRLMVSVKGVGVLIFDEAGDLIDCNDAWLTMSGYTREEVASRALNWSNLTPPEDMPVSERQLKVLAETGRIGPYEKEYVLKNGKRLGMMFAGSALENGAIVEYCIDASDRRRVELEAREAERRLRAAHEALLRVNADLRHFSYAVSHDMQEPLRMVTSYTQLLARDYRAGLDDRGHQLIDYAVTGARRMEALLNDLREYWSVDEGKVDELAISDSNDVLAKTLGYLQAAVAESGAVIASDPLPVVQAEPYPLTLLFQNLIGNAIKYARRGTVPRIRVWAEQDTTVWRFSVADNGIGIEAQDLTAIFAPFKRLHAGEYPGTGLGLAMCQRIVERYRGRIWVESVPGQGSTFHFTLPVVDSSS